MFLGGACAWVTPSTLATLPFLVTPSSWRRFLLATPSFLGTPPFLATPVAASNEKKDKD